MHHLPSRDYREKIIKELNRVIKPGGIIVVTVWNIWRNKYRKNVYKNWFQKIIGKSQLDWNDCLIPFRDGNGLVFERYHHAFTRRELKKIFQRAGFKNVRVKNIGRNIFLIGKKQ